MSNPFASRHTAPGRVVYTFPPGESAAGLLERMRAAGGGELVGDHGVGKSTLLRTLEAVASGHGPVVYTRAVRGRPLPVLAAVGRTPPGGLLLADSFEVVPGPLRRLVRAWCRARRITLVTTMHRASGFGCVYTVLPSRDLFLDVALGWCPRGISREEMISAWEQADGNPRGAVAVLYDLWEERMRV